MSSHEYIFFIFHKIIASSEKIMKKKEKREKSYRNFQLKLIFIKIVKESKKICFQNINLHISVIYRYLIWLLQRKNRERGQRV